MHRTPRTILVAVLLSSLLAALAAAGGIVLAARDRHWYMVAFQCVAFIASVMGVLIGANRIRTGQAIGMFCTGGVVSVAAVLSQPSIVGDLLEKKTIPTAMVAGVDIVPFAAGVVAIGAGLAWLSGLTVLMRRPTESFRLLIKGVLAGLPAVLAVGAMVVPTVRSTLVGLNPLAQTILVIVGTAVLGVLVSISGHCIIRAFEIGAVSESGPPSTKPT
jgi:hypothetical protein